MKKTRRRNTHNNKKGRKRNPTAYLSSVSFSGTLFQRLILIILAFFLGSFLLHLFSFNRDADYESSAIASNLKEVNRFNYSNVPTVEEEIEETESEDDSETTSTTDKAAYQKAFRNSIILGDSVTEGISSYGFLSSDIVFSKIGASLSSISSMFTEAAAAYPKNAFFAMGMNDMGNYRDDVDGFIKEYKKYLQKFHKASPKTKIYICSISHPTDAAISKKSWLGYSDKYNAKIKAMCKKMNYTYIDVSSIFKNHPDFYESDGIHATPSYYPYWLKLMAKAADLDLAS